jgi:hypothetical protein
MASMETPSWFAASLDLGAARAAVERETPQVRELRTQSRELLDAALRLAETIEARELHVARKELHLKGARLALRGLVEAAQTDLQVLLSTASPEVLALLCKNASDLDLVRSALVGEERPIELSLIEGAHTELVNALEKDVRALDSVLVGRARSLGLATLAVVIFFVAGAWGIAKLTAPTNLAVGKAWKTSSTALVCNPERHQCGGTRTDIFFHTQNEPNPWIEFDLETPQSFSRLLVRNRLDMGLGRAVPLIVETSNDRQTWATVARRNESFTTWEPTFTPVNSRYLRLRVEKKTWFHLESVEIYP